MPFVLGTLTCEYCGHSQPEWVLFVARCAISGSIFVIISLSLHSAGSVILWDPYPFCMQSGMLRTCKGLDSNICFHCLSLPLSVLKRSANHVKCCFLQFRPGCVRLSCAYLCTTIELNQALAALHVVSVALYGDWCVSMCCFACHINRPHLHVSTQTLLVSDLHESTKLHCLSLLARLERLSEIPLSLELSDVKEAP